VIYTASRSLSYDFYPIFFFYDGPNPPAKVFEKFNAIRPAFDRPKLNPIQICSEVGHLVWVLPRQWPPKKHS